MQKRAASLILNTDSKHPSLPLFLKLMWLPIYERIKYFRCITVYKALSGLTPPYVTFLNPLSLYIMFVLEVNQLINLNFLRLIQTQETALAPF